MIIDLSAFQVLDVNGKEFVKVGLETPTLAFFVNAAIKLWKGMNLWHTSYGYVTPEPEVLAPCVGGELLSTGTAAQIAQKMVDCGFVMHYPKSDLQTQAEWNLFNATTLATQLTRGYQDTTPRMTAYLDTPIVLPTLMGISLTVMGLKPLETYALLGQDVASEDYLWYEPEFTAPMPAPVLRGIGNIQYGVPTRLSFAALLAGGYYYQGIYDARFAVGFYSTRVGREYMSVVYFWVKNFIQCTETGIITTGITVLPPPEVPAPLLAPVPAEPVAPDVGFTHAFNWISAFLAQIGDWFDTAYENIRGVVLLGDWLATPFFWIANRFYGLSAMFLDLRDLIDLEILPILRVVFTPSNILSYLNNWFNYVVRPILSSYVNDVIEALGLDSLRTAWNTFWGTLYPSLVNTINTLSSNWNYFWSVTFPNLVSFQWLITWWNSRLLDVNNLINSAFMLRQSWWSGWQEIRNTVFAFFENPLDWLLDKFTDWFLGPEG